MSAPETIGVGLLGLGNVGRGVVRILETHAREIEQRLGARLAIRRVLVRDVERPRAGVPEGATLCDDAQQILEDPKVEIVVEVMGGLMPARDYVLAALAAGKSVVTANKTLLATHGEEIFAAASRARVDVLYEGAVGGGIPIIRTLREAFASDRVQALSGIVNGTTNFILSEMVGGGRPFEAALAEAQARGFAEADPSSDVDGRDAAEKLCLLAALSFGVRVTPEEVYTEGIRDIDVADLKWAAEFGYQVKLLALAQRHEDGTVALRVHPTLIPATALLANVTGPFNAVLVTSLAMGPSLLFGQGAGSLPTGSAVVADLIDAARNLRLGVRGRVPHRATGDAFIEDLRPRPMATVETANYLRFTVRDQPGVLGRITSVLGAREVSISAMVQKEAAGGGPVPIVVLTHRASDAAVAEALCEIDALPFVAEPTRRIRIEQDPPLVR